MRKLVLKKRMLTEEEKLKRGEEIRAAMTKAREDNAKMTPEERAAIPEPEGALATPLDYDFWYEYEE